MDRRTFTAALVPVALAGCATMPPTAQRYVAPPVGARWAHRRTDSGSYGSGTREIPTHRIEHTWQGSALIGLQTPEGTLLLRPTGEWIAQVNPQGAPVVTWDPPLVWDWPLEIGKNWARKYTMTLHPSNRNVTYDVKQAVEAYEDVTVPAGTLGAFRLSSEDSLGNRDRFWFSSNLGVFVRLELQRTALHTQGFGMRTAELVSFSR